jgi:hypothetical protein
MHRPGAVLATLLTTLALTSTAAANTYCVAPATGCDVTATSLHDALSQAATNPGADTISLGAGTYQEDGLVYNPADNAAVTITGAGRDATIIRPQTSADNSVTLTGQGGPIALSAATVLTGTHTSNVALELDQGGSLANVTLLSASGATSPGGVESLAATTVSDSTISVTGNGFCVNAHGTGTVRVQDSTLEHCSGAINTGADRLFAQRLRISDVVNGISVNAGTANLDDSVVLLANSAGFAAGAGISGPVGSTLYVNQTTLLGVGSGIGVQSFNHAGSGAAHVEVYDSIIRGFTNALVSDATAGHPASVMADFNDYDGTASVAGTGTLTSDHVHTEAPQFVDALGGDYHLQAGSPLIDLDPEPIVAIWEESATDLEGTVRIINGKRDFGAFERPLATAAAAGAATNVTQTSATIPATANGGGAKAAVKLVYGTTSAYGSEVTLDRTPADFADHAYAAGLSGLAPGTTYHYALVVTNPAGTASSADQTFTTGSPPVTQQQPPPVAKAALSALRISPARFKAAAHGATFAKARTGAIVTYTMSAAGTVKLRVYRAVKGVRVGGRCLAKSPQHRTGRACTRYVAVGRAVSRSSVAGVNRARFSGRVGGHKLRPGVYRLQSLDPAGATQRSRFTIVRR